MIRSAITAMLLAIAALQPGAASARKVPDVYSGTIYRTAVIDGVRIAYREAGPPDAPTILLLHGFPSSSRMFERLFPLLSDRYHLVAPDYVGFGNSDAPDPAHFSYTFDHLATVVADLVRSLGLKHYTLFMQDYGGPIGFRLALADPDKVDALIIQNAVADERGLGPLWTQRRAFWGDRVPIEQRLRANLMSFDAARSRHVGGSPHPERYDPDAWNDEFAFLNRPGEVEIQSELFFDYRNNVASYPAWQDYLRTRQPPTLVLWGRYDPSFVPQGATAYTDYLPHADIKILDAGHFAIDEALPEVARSTKEFLAAVKLISVAGQSPSRKRPRRR